MTNQRKSFENTRLFSKVTPKSFLRARRRETFILMIVIFGFVIAIFSLFKLSVRPTTDFGESVEKIMPPLYWTGIAIMVATISYMITRLDAAKLRIPFLISCAMLIVSMRSAMAILSPYPIVQDTWGQIWTVATWQKYGIFSPEGLAFFQRGYTRGWPAAFLLAYSFTSAGISIFTFYQWAPTIIFILELFVIYFLFKELANEKIGMVSAFLFTLLNTNGFFPLHYSPQTLGALFYLVAMYAVVKAYKTRTTKHLALALVAIFAVVFTHHMSTFFLGLSLLGVYLSKYILILLKKMDRRDLLPFNVELGTFVVFSLPLAVFTFALWYFYGFIIYRVDATQMLTAIMRLLTTHQPVYHAGYVGKYFQISLFSQLSILIFPAFILVTAAMFLFGRILKKESWEGYLWFIIGWAGALFFAFVMGNLLYGNYIDPLRAQEIITVALCPASALFLLRIFESKSQYMKGLITIGLIIVAFFSVFSIYRGSQKIIYFEIPWWIRLLIPQ